MESPTPPRDHLIDAARILSVLAVVVYHCLFFEVSLVGGELVVTRWIPGGGLLVAGWFVMLLPVFFVAGGFAHATASPPSSATSPPSSATPPTTPTRGAGLAHHLARRGRRLAGPLALFVTALAAVSTVAAWLPGTPPEIPYPGTTGLGWLELATTVSRDYADFLWFITVYLVLVMLAPLMVRAHDRWGLRALAALAVAAAVADWLAVDVDPRFRAANWVLVWLLCHQFGVAYQRGWFRRGPAWVPWVTLTTAAAGVVALVTVAGYPLSPITNYYPPTLAIALLALAQASVLGLLHRAGVMRDVAPRTARRFRILGAHLVTVYLWQAACIILATLGLTAVGRLLPALAPYAVSRVAVVVASFAVIVAVVPWIARVERLLVEPWAPRQPGAGAEGRRARRGGMATSVAFGLLLAGSALVWQNGAVLHPDRPWSTAGVLLVWAGSAAIGPTSRAPGAWRRGRAVLAPRNGGR